MHRPVIPCGTTESCLAMPFGKLAAARLGPEACSTGWGFSMSAASVLLTTVASAGGSQASDSTAAYACAAPLASAPEGRMLPQLGGRGEGEVGEATLSDVPGALLDLGRGPEGSLGDPLAFGALVCVHGRCAVWCGDAKREVAGQMQCGDCTVLCRMGVAVGYKGRGKAGQNATRTLQGERRL